MHIGKSAMVKRIWTPMVSGLVALSGAGLLVIGCAERPSRETERVVPELVLEDLKFRVYRDVRLAARGTAQRAIYRRDTGDFGSEGIQITVEQARGGRVDLSAPYGRGNSRSRTFFAWGGVKLVQKRTTAITEEAHYLPSDGLVRGDHPITVRGPNYSLAGPGFFLDPQTEELVVIGGAMGEAGQRKAK